MKIRNYMTNLVYNFSKQFFLLLLFNRVTKSLTIKYMLKYKSRANKSIFNKLTNKIFWEKYYLKNNEKNKNKFRDMTLLNNEGVFWAKEYFKQHFRTLSNLRKKKVGCMKKIDSDPIYLKVIKHIRRVKKNKIKDIFLIQIGSSSGMDLVFFKKIFPSINIISTDINNEILDFQRKIHKYDNFFFLKMHAHDVEKLFKSYNLRRKKIIFISIGSDQYLSPKELDTFFSKLSKISNANFFFQEPLSIEFLKGKIKSSYRHDISYNHNYEYYVKKNKLKVIRKKITHPYKFSKNFHKDVCHYFIEGKS